MLKMKTDNWVKKEGAIVGGKIKFPDVNLWQQLCHFPGKEGNKNRATTWYILVFYLIINGGNCAY